MILGYLLVGHVTSIWKGRGDKEQLANHRGITTSSAIGSVVEALIDHRMEAHVTFSQAQGGGQRGASTCDHLLIIRAMIDIAIKDKKKTFLTFYDVTKAFDNVNNDDMLKTVWESGLRGKPWRLLRKMNIDLRAAIKTRHGLTREVEMEIGGRQGSRLTCRNFSKMME